MADVSKSDYERGNSLSLTDIASQRSSSRSYRSSLDGSPDGNDDDYFVERQRRSLLGRMLLRLGLSSSSRRNSWDYMAAAPRDELPRGVLKSSPHSPRRRSRRSYLSFFFRRMLVIIPIVLLMVFGILHILQVSIGRARLFWDVEQEDLFLPHWGEHGQPGEGLITYPGDATRDILPIPCHSHNDYWRRVPLFDAIHAGCTGVEADVWLFDDDLYVGHNMGALTRNRTFREMYVNPLVDMLDQMNLRRDFPNDTMTHGVFDVDPLQTLVLLVDFKTNGRDLFPVVSEQLQALREKDYLTYWDGKQVNSRAVTVVGTGNTPFDMVVANTTHRDIFFDAPLGRLWEAPPPPESAVDARSSSLATPPSSDSTNSKTSSQQGQVGTESITSLDDFNPHTSYYASTSLRSAVGFLWRGSLSPRQIEIIRGQIRGAQSRGLKARYWDTPSWPISVRNHVWRVLMREGADVLNVDDLQSAARRDWSRHHSHEWW